LKISHIISPKFAPKAYAIPTALSKYATFSPMLSGKYIGIKV